MARPGVEPAQSSRSPRCGASRTSAADGVTIRLVVKTQPSEQFQVMRELRMRHQGERSTQAGVEIPYPQRTVWVRRDADSSAESEEGMVLDDVADEPPPRPATSPRKRTARADWQVLTLRRRRRG